MSDGSQQFVPGLTFRSVFASLFCLLLAGMYTQYSEVILAEGNAIAETALPVPALSILLLIILLVAVLYSFARIRLLTRAELVCVFFTMLFALPLMTQGMWHRLFGLISVPPRTASFQYIDAYDDNLWPHGPNLLDGMFTSETTSSDESGVVWESTEYEEGVRAVLPTLTNSDATSEKVIVCEVPLNMDDRATLVPTSPHLISVLARTQDVKPKTEVFCRAYEDSSEASIELFSVGKAERKTYLHKLGYERIGIYGATFSSDCKKNIRLEFGIKGIGSVTFADPKFMSVSALEGAFRGRQIISESDYASLDPETRRSDLIVKPDNMWSLAGLKFLIAGYIPLREWVRPAIVWSSFVILVTASFFAMNIMMRKKWAESERYPFPMTRIPVALIGSEETDDEKALPPVWRNRFAWAGFFLALFWALMKGWHTFNTTVPDLSVSVPLGPYFQDPGWGGMWNTTFTVSIFIVSIAIFFELNVLISMVIGFFFFRSLYWFGQFTGLSVNSGYPWRYEQATGAYIGYFLIVVFFSRKYLFEVVRSAVRGKVRDEEDILSARAALVLLVTCFVGAIFWGKFVGMPVLTIVVYFSFLVLLGFVTSKFRAECGLPAGYFTPYNAMLLIGVLGGMPVFGASGMLVALLLSGFLTVTVFFLIPGAQLELIEIGRRMHIQPRHIAYTCLIGVLGGLFIGGWVFLSNAYAIGGDNIKFQWSFNGLGWFFNSYKTELANTTSDWLRAGADETVGHVPHWQRNTMILWGGIAMVLTVLRQFFSGFWFHPIGFILGSSHMMTDFAWGSVFVAWIIRALVLKFGGATSVRRRLQPFFVGAMAGAVVSIVFFTVINGIVAAGGGTVLHSVLP
jgi:hypothetical protein